MYAFHEEDDLLAMDKEDVLEVLRIRFGDVPEDISNKINEIKKLDAMQRLIMVAANASNYNVFLEELLAGEASYKLLGERFDPLSQDAGGFV
ncbi:hypothetical protein [Brevibacillus daliensis]|uniref:hypothetical protein n=1 Tax=Brevibacillus daliensis TaxID=2892995 RepID=UPI001E30A03E|nr:hypothetical protein [Brevibacillus daliensis]